MGFETIKPQETPANFMESLPEAANDDEAVEHDGIAVIKASAKEVGLTPEAYLNSYLKFSKMGLRVEGQYYNDKIKKDKAVLKEFKPNPTIHALVRDYANAQKIQEDAQIHRELAQKKTVEAEMNRHLAEKRKEAVEAHKYRSSQRKKIAKASRAYALKKGEEARHLKEKAERDSLTGLLNRGTFDVRMDEIKNGQLEARRETDKDPERLFVLFVDADAFKPINDNYGHAVGDLAIKKIADTLKDSLRDDDAIGRWGGDEFAVLAKEKDMQTTLKTAERIRQSISENPLVLENGTQIDLSVSIGVSEFGDMTREEALDQADRALYAAKHGDDSQRNRNQVWSYDTETETSVKYEPDQRDN